METTSKLLEDNQIELSVTLPADEVDKAVKQVYAEAAQTRIKGFRQGKAPRNVLDKVFGGPEFFLAEATEELVKSSYLKAIDSQDLVPIDQPDLSGVEPATEGEDYQYSFTITVAPPYELSSYDPVEIELPSTEPTEEEVQERIDTMMGYYAEYVEVTDRPSQLGDILTLDMEVTQEGERVESMSGEGVPYELGRDAMPEGFEQHFIGISPGDEISVDFKLPYYDGDADDEQDLHAEAKLLKIEERQIPEMTDEWVKEKLEYDSAEEFRQVIYDSIKVQNESAIPSLKERRVAAAIGERLQGEPPEALVSDFAQDIYQDIFNSLQSQGVTLDFFLAMQEQSPEDFQKDVEAQAMGNARIAMAFDAWARQMGIEVSDEDIETEFEESGVDDPKGLFEQWVEVGRISEIRQGIRRMKASKQLNDEAIITEISHEEQARRDAAAAAEAAGLILPESAASGLVLPDSGGLVVPDLVLPSTAEVERPAARAQQPAEPAEGDAEDEDEAETEAEASEATAEP